MAPTQCSCRSGRMKDVLRCVASNSASQPRFVSDRGRPSGAASSPRGPLALLGSGLSQSCASPARRTPTRHSVGPTSWLITTQPVTTAAISAAQLCWPTTPPVTCSTKASVTPDWDCRVIQRCRRTTGVWREAEDAMKLPTPSATKRAVKNTAMVAAYDVNESRLRLAPTTVKNGGMTKGAVPCTNWRSSPPRVDMCCKNIEPSMHTSKGSILRESKASGIHRGRDLFNVIRPW
mmetsp:Transcript_37348/g.112920  ORF Transcript_37348/g.112920 Transcript_37348/m.112920 type:complete len:234 (+) Transcript_37348:144-845(+)